MYPCRCPLPQYQSSLAENGRYDAPTPCGHCFGSVDTHSASQRPLNEPSFVYDSYQHNGLVVQDNLNHGAVDNYGYQVYYDKLPYDHNGNQLNSLPAHGNLAHGTPLLYGAVHYNKSVTSRQSGTTTQGAYRAFTEESFNRDFQTLQPASDADNDGFDTPYMDVGTGGYGHGDTNNYGGASLDLAGNVGWENEFDMVSHEDAMQDVDLKAVGGYTTAPGLGEAYELSPASIQSVTSSPESTDGHSAEEASAAGIAKDSQGLWQCPYCYYSSGRLNNVKRHLPKHAEQGTPKPFSCRFEQCECAYTRKNKLVLHEKKPHGGKDVVCSGCGMRFTTPALLEQHVPFCPGSQVRDDGGPAVGQTWFMAIQAGLSEFLPGNPYL